MKTGGPNMKTGGPIASRWNIVHIGYARVGFALFVYFFLPWLFNANAFSGGIWEDFTIKLIC